MEASFGSAITASSAKSVGEKTANFDVAIARPNAVMPLHTKTLNVGDPAPLFALPTPAGDRLILRDKVGQPTVLLFYGKDENVACQAIAQAFAQAFPQFQALNAQVFAISTNTPSDRQGFQEREQLPFTLLSDVSGKTSRQYGVFYDDCSSDPPAGIYMRVAMLLDANLKIRGIYSLNDLETAIEGLLRDLSLKIPQEPPRHITVQAPVLLIPSVLSPETCQTLIQLWETDNSESGSMQRDGQKTIAVMNYAQKIRRDHFLKRTDLIEYLDRVMRRRVFPEIQKAFNFEVSRREDYRIGGYDSQRGGYFRPHRDNTTGGTAHRRFAMTLNLNAEEYEGGYLRFPEYGNHLYKPPTGHAVIFSCSLMHEATDVLSGRRFGLFSFLYGEKEAQQRREYERQIQNDYTQIVSLSQDLPNQPAMPSGSVI